MGIIGMLKFQMALAGLAENYVPPAENDYFAY
jgi:hypothetical protein